MSVDKKTKFIRRPDITGGSGNYTIAYNLYDSNSNAINYFYSDDAMVAVTCPYNGTFNVYIVITDTVTNETCSLMTNWFEITGYGAGLTVSAPEWRLSDDGKTCFIMRPTISGASGSYTIAYNIYDSNSNPINYFYSNESAVAATCPYNGTFNVFVVVMDSTGTIKTVMTGWFDVTGYARSAITFDNVDWGDWEIDLDLLEEAPDEESAQPILLPETPDADVIPVMEYEAA